MSEMTECGSVKNQWSCTNWLYLQINPLEGVIDSFSVKYLYAHSKNMFTTTSSVFNRQSYFVSHIATNCKLARKSEKHQPNTQWMFVFIHTYNISL